MNEISQACMLSATLGSSSICHFCFPDGATKAQGVNSLAQCLMGSNLGRLTPEPLLINLSET